MSKKFGLNNYNPKLDTILNFELPVDPKLASEFHKRLVQMINDFDKNLDQEHEVGMRLVSFGKEIK